MKNGTIAALAIAFLAASLPASASDAAMAKLMACMKLKAATPEQKACLAEVEAMRRATPPAAAPAPMTARMRLSAAPGKSAPPPTVIPVPPEVKQAAAAVGLSGARPTAVTPGAMTSGINVGDLKGLDLESAMMAVQSQRAKLLEAQLKDQIDGVEARNEQIARLNQAIGKMNQYEAAFPANANAAATLAATGTTHAGPQGEYRGTVPGCRLEQEINTLLFQTGQKPFSQQGSGTYNARGRTLDADGNLSYGDPRYYYVGGLGGDTTKAQLDAAIVSLKATIDSLNSSQQMDMLKLQSLTNKRNEAFDLMTNFIKKMADSRSSILGNMR